jgi:Domain of unknown function (DUF4399)/Penicillin-Binding Protein C-terminus Family
MRGTRLIYKDTWVMIALAVMLTLALAGCASGEGQGTGETEPAEAMVESEAAAGAASVRFVEPANGATVSSPVTVKMEATGLQIEPAGAVREGAGHFHVIVDDRCSTPGQIVPTDDTHIHYGKGQREAQLTLSPGQHTLCLQAADGVHRALDLTEEITITVQ